MKKILLKIITPEALVSEEEVMQVLLPIIDGEVTILPNHIPYIGALKSGEVIYKKDSADNEGVVLAVSGGFVEFHDNTLVLLADTAEYADDIDMQRAQEARLRAEKLMQQTEKIDSEEYARVAASLEKQLTRLRIARKHHTRHGMHPEA